MTYAEIKTLIQTIYAQSVGFGKLIDDSSGNPTALALLLDLVNNRISSYPREWSFCKVTSTINLTGASSYDLSVLFPDLKSVYQVYGINQYQDVEFQANYESNISPLNDVCTIKGKTLIFTGTAPTGTATIQYKSKYLVKNAGGTRQQYFLDDSDTSVLDSSDINVLIFGLGQFINWQVDSKDNVRRQEVAEWFKEAWNNLLLHNEQTSQVHSLL